MSTAKSLEALKKEALSCKRCHLQESRTQVVWGAGEITSQCFIVGEAPGEQEDIKGIPFVGRSGILLRETLDLAGFNLDKVFITNIVSCRPPGNRNPTEEETATCSTWLNTKIELASPKLIVAVGKFAVSWFLRKPPRLVPITKLAFAGGVFKYPPDKRDFALVIPAVHPSYVLRGGCSRGDFLIQISRAAAMAKKLGLTCTS